MTNEEERKRSEEEPRQDDSTEETFPAPQSDPQVRRMEQAAERVGDEIEEAKETAEQAQSHDPQPETANEDDSNRSS